MGRTGEVRIRSVPRPAAMLVAAIAAAASVATVASPAAGQTATAPCDFTRCGLRIEERRVFRGPGGDVVGHARTFHPDLRLLATAGDSAAAHARAATRYTVRAELAEAVSFATILPTLHIWSPSRPHSDVAWTALGLYGVALGGAILTAHWDRRARGRLSRAVWWYNRAVAAGEMPTASPDLPPLDPRHYARTGFAWGLAGGMAAGTFLARDEDDAALLELVALPATSAAAGWLVGRMIRRGEERRP